MSNVILKNQFYPKLTDGIIMLRQYNFLVAEESNFKIKVELISKRGRHILLSKLVGMELNIRNWSYIVLIIIYKWKDFFLHLFFWILLYIDIDFFFYALWILTYLRKGEIFLFLRNIQFHSISLFIMDSILWQMLTLKVLKALGS